MSEVSEISPPTLNAIREARQKLGVRVRRTPVWQWKGDIAAGTFGADTGVFLKLELFQYAGSFKPRLRRRQRW